MNPWSEAPHYHIFQRHPPKHCVTDYIRYTQGYTCNNNLFFSLIIVLRPFCQVSKISVEKHLKIHPELYKLDFRIYIYYIFWQHSLRSTE